MLACVFDSLDRGLAAIMGSSEKATAELDKLREVAKLPGIGMEEAEKGSIALQAAGASAELARHAIEAFGNAIARAGKGKEDLDAVDSALSHILATGRATEREIREISMRAPEVRQAMLKAFGTADTMLLEKAKIGGQEFVTRLTRELAKLPKAASGVKNDLDNATDSINQSLNQIAKVGLPALSAALSAIVPLIQDTTTVFVTSASAIGGFIHDIATYAGKLAIIRPLIDDIKNGYAALHLTAEAERQDKSLGQFGDAIGLRDHAAQMTKYIAQLRDMERLQRSGLPNPDKAAVDARKRWGAYADTAGVNQVAPRNDLGRALDVAGLGTSVSLNQIEAGINRLAGLRQKMTSEADKMQQAYFDTQKKLNGGTVRPKPETDTVFSDKFNLQARLDAAAGLTKGAADRAARELLAAQNNFDRAYKSFFTDAFKIENDQFEQRALKLKEEAATAKESLAAAFAGNPKEIASWSAKIDAGLAQALATNHDDAIAHYAKVKSEEIKKAAEAVAREMKAWGKTIDDSTDFKKLKSETMAPIVAADKILAEQLKASGMDDSKEFKAWQDNYKKEMEASAAITEHLSVAIADAGARYLEATGSGDHYADALARLGIITKSLTDEQKGLVDQLVALRRRCRRRCTSRRSKLAAYRARSHRRFVDGSTISPAARARMPPNGSRRTCAANCLPCSPICSAIRSGTDSSKP